MTRIRQRSISIITHTRDIFIWTGQLPGCSSNRNLCLCVGGREIAASVGAVTILDISRITSTCQLPSVGWSRGWSISSAIQSIEIEIRETDTRFYLIKSIRCNIRFRCTNSNAYLNGITIRGKNTYDRGNARRSHVSCKLIVRVRQGYNKSKKMI